MNLVPDRRQHRRAGGLLGAALALGLLQAAGLGAVPGTGLAPAVAAARTVVDDGHVDLGPRITGGSWQLQARDDTVSPPVWRRLDDLALAVDDSAKIDVPADDTYAFLGTPGDDVWVLPQVQRAGIVWPGWNTQDPSVVSGVSGDVTWTVQDVDGPGRFWIFVSGAFGAPTVVFDGAKPWPQSTTIERNVHAHGNWAFDAPGLYRLTLRMSARGTTGGTLTDTRTLVVAVGPAARGSIPATGTPTGGGSGTGSTSGDAAGQGDGSDALDAEGGTLPNTGAGYLPALAGAGVLTVAAGLLLRRAGRRGATGGSS